MGQRVQRDWGNLMDLKIYAISCDVCLCCAGGFLQSPEILVAPLRFSKAFPSVFKTIVCWMPSLCTADFTFWVLGILFNFLFNWILLATDYDCNQTDLYEELIFLNKTQPLWFDNYSFSLLPSSFLLVKSIFFLYTMSLF